MTPDPRVAFDVGGRVAIVTGGGRGLGRAMSVGLAQCGARVVAVGRTESDLDDTVHAVTQAGGEAVAVRADVADYASHAFIVERAIDRFGAIDILVNNAGDPRPAFIAEMDPSFVEEIYRTNVHGPTFLAAAAWPYLDASGHGSVINIISIALRVGGGSRLAAYRGSKAALQQVSRVMAIEWAPTVRVNTLALGPFETSFGGGWPDAARMAIGERSPLGRIGSYDEIVPHVLYLASDASAYVTGTDVTVDGGMLVGKGERSPTR